MLKNQGVVYQIYSSIKEAERENLFSDTSLRYYYYRSATNNDTDISFRGFNWKFEHV